MKISTAGNNSRNFRITVAAAILAGAGLSGCVGDPYYDNPRYGQTYYNQPVYQSPPRYYDQRSNPQSRYYDPYQPSQGYYYPSR